MKKQSIVFLLCILNFCKAPSLEYFCDPSTQIYWTIFLIQNNINKNQKSICHNPISESSPPYNLVCPSVTSPFQNGGPVSLSASVNGNNILFSISPSLPNGLSLDSNTGTISGSYSNLLGSNSTFTLTATNTAGNLSCNFTPIFFGKKPLKTGQNLCQDNVAGAFIPCGVGLGVGQDGDYQYGTVQSFTGPTNIVSTDYVTTDSATNLVWKSCSEGQSGATCSTGAANQVNHATAISNCQALNLANSGAGYANRKTWRLPNINEVRSLYDYTTSPVVATNVFTGFPLTFYFWSSTSKIGNGEAFLGEPMDGTTQSDSKGANHSYRCVADAN